jgi:hypothetical protein
LIRGGGALLEQAQQFENAGAWFGGGAGGISHVGASSNEFVRGEYHIAMQAYRRTFSAPSGMLRRRRAMNKNKPGRKT